MADKINVKDIRLKVIPSTLANNFIKKHHYSGKVVNNSSLHFGCFYKDILHGVMSYGSPMMKHKVLPLVETGQTEKQKWSSVLELNRMAFDNTLPANSESRCLSVSFRLLRKNAPHVKWILSYSDATASGDGTIYRASGFELTQIKKNKSIVVLPDGKRIASISLQKDMGLRTRVYKKYNVTMETGAKINNLLKIAHYAEGYQLRYIKLLDSQCSIVVPILPFSAIDESGAGMLRGEKVSQASRHSAANE